MKNLFKNWTANTLRDKILEVLSRFPVSAIIAIGSGATVMAMIAMDNTGSDMGKLILTTIPTYFLSIGIYLLAESWKLKKLESNLLQIITGGFAAGFFLTLADSLDGGIDSNLSFWLSAFGFISLIFIAPFIRTSLRGKYKQNPYYEYFYHIGMIFVITTILTAAMQALGFIAIASVQELFDLGYIMDDAYGYWTAFTCMFAAPIFALTKMPAADKMEKLDTQENAFFTFLVRYIGVPFIYLYFLILYAYTIKVLLNFGEWPKGEVSWMVIGFSTFGYLLYVCTYRTPNNVFVTLFRKYFPFVALPQIAMLFYAIYLRINQYDLTSNRYFVVAFGIFLLSISLYYAISREKRLIAVPLSLAVVIFLISIGPWSVHSLPEARQYNRLISNLEKANILKDGKITPLATIDSIDKELSGEIYDEIQYLCNSGNCERMKELFHNEVKDLQNSGYNWTVIDRITTSIKVARAGTLEFQANGYVELSTTTTTYPGSSPVLNVDGYHYATQFNNWNQTTPDLEAIIRVSINSDTAEVWVHEKGQPEDKISIKTQLDEILQKHSIGTTYLKSGDLDFTVESARYKLRFIPDRLAIRPANASGTVGKYAYYNSGYVLIKRK